MEPYFLFLVLRHPALDLVPVLARGVAGVLIAGGNLIKKVLFPAEVLPVVTRARQPRPLPVRPADPAAVPGAGTASSRRTALLLPLPILVQLVFTLGLALFVSALTVHFRDIQSILGHVLHLWFFATPVLYFYGDPGPRCARVLRLNPMTHMLVSYQQMLFDGRLRPLARPAALAARGRRSLTFALGAFLFDRLRDTLAEEV